MNRRAKAMLSSVRRFVRSRGFGIHSPFAYVFVREVLRQPREYAYYGYSRLAARVDELRRGGFRPSLGLKECRLLLRVAAWMSPGRMLCVGSTDDMAPYALRVADSRTQVLTYPTREQESIVGALDRLFDSPHPASPFMVVENIFAADVDALAGGAARVLELGGTVVLFNLMRRKSLTAELSVRINAAMTRGMTFSNGQTAIMVGLRHLPRQRFNVWF